MPHSHHSHSGQFCRHATGTLEEIVLEAIRQGFEVYGLSEHVPRYRQEDFYPEEEGLTPNDLMNQFDAFLGEAHRLKAKYASKIAVLVGLETEFITELDLDRLRALLEKYGERVEYLVGSIHHVDGIPIDFDLPTYQRALSEQKGDTEHDRLESFLCSYFDAQYQLLESFRPEIVGHVDLCRLYSPQLRLLEYPRAWKLMERNVDYAIQYGALFEVNAAAFRKNWNTAYPAEDIIKVIIQRGGRFALSDDSHGVHAVGLNYHRLAQYLQGQGVSEIWYLQNDFNYPSSPGRSVRPVKLEGACWAHTFWNGRS